MKHELCLIFLGAIMVMSTLAKSIPEDPAALRTVSDTINHFAMDLCNNVTQAESKNTLCAPISVGIVMTMVAFGARGTTASQMRSVLRMPEDDNVVKSGVKSLTDALNDDRKIELRMANKMFMMDGMSVKQDFLDITEQKFKSKAESINFKNTEAASKTINDWASEKTNNRIKDLIKPDDLQNAKVMMLNAVYFKGKWANKFDAAMTSPQPFHIDDKTTKDVPMMHRNAVFRHGPIRDVSASFIELPYESDDPKEFIIMSILIPHEIDGLTTVESKLDTVDWKQVRADSEKESIDLTMPKFKIESTIDLEQVLKKMGMAEIFTDNADFTGITDNPPLKISKALQKTFIEVNEEGTEAAAVSAVTAVANSSPPSITIDRPFAFVIMMVNEDMTTILFQGRVTDPQ